MTPAFALMRALVDPRGRADRTGFLLTMTTGVLFGQGLLLFASGPGMPDWFQGPAQAAALWMIAAPCQRRLHDLNRSGWNFFAALPLLFMWGAVMSICAGAAAVAMGNDGLAMLDAGQPFYFALAGLIGLPAFALMVWLATATGQDTDNVFGPRPERPLGLSFPPVSVKLPAAAAV